MRTYIMAAGRATRWKYGKIYKQFVKVQNERIIDRAVRLFPGAIIVAADDEFIKKCKSETVKIKQQNCICSSIMQLEWGSKDLLILCGDVYWTYNAASKIKNCDQGLMFFGNRYEIFGIYISQKYHRKMKECFYHAIEDYNNDISEGKLWNVYRHLIGVSEHIIDGYFTHMTDRTTDFDTLLQYEKFLRNG